MATLSDSTIFTAGGGVFVATTAISTTSIGSGATGTILTITPPAGERVKLTALAGLGNMTSLTTMTVGGDTVITAVKLWSSTVVPDQANSFKIGMGLSGQEPIIGEADEAFVFTTNVATSHNFLYSYQFGVLA